MAVADDDAAQALVVQSERRDGDAAAAELRAQAGGELRRLELERLVRLERDARPLVRDDDALQDGRVTRFEAVERAGGEILAGAILQPD